MTEMKCARCGRTYQQLSPSGKAWSRDDNFNWICEDCETQEEKDNLDDVTKMFRGTL